MKVNELKDKLSADLSAYNGKSSNSAKRAPAPLQVGGNLSEATEALMVLGYDKNSISNAILGIDPKTDTGEIIRLALKKLAK